METLNTIEKVTLLISVAIVTLINLCVLTKTAKNRRIINQFFNY